MLNQLLDNAPIGLAVLGPDFRYLTVNRHLAEMNGLPAEEHVGRKVDEVVPFLAVQARRAFDQVRQTQQPLLDVEFSGASAKDPSRIRHYSLNWFPATGRNGEPDCVGVVVTEITERKEAAVALRDSETALRCASQHAHRQLAEIETLYATVPAGLALVDPELRYVRANERLAEISGLPLAQLVGRKVSEVVPALWPQLEPFYRRVIEQQKPVHDVEVQGFTAARPQDERCWLACYDPVFDSDGRFAGIAVLVQEVTESKRTQQNLSESAHQMQRQLAEIEAIYASAPIGLCVFDDQLRYTRINHRLAEINGVPAEAHIGKTPAEIVPDFAVECEKAFRKVMETGEPLLDFELSGCSPAGAGEPRYWNNRWVPLKDERGRVVAISVAIEETTERRKVEASLRESERLYRAIGESIDYGVWVATPDGRNTYASDSFLKLVGLTQEQCSNAGWMDVLHPDDIEASKTAWLDCLRTQGRWDWEHRFRGTDGRYHFLLARGMPVRNEQGEIICWAGINLDITRLKQTEERLREGQKLESIGLLAGGIAHDFNNILVGVIGNASLAQEMLPQGHVAASFLEEIVAAGERAAHLTQQMLAYSGKGRYVVGPLQLSALVEGARGLIQPSIPKKIALQLELAPSLPPIEADAGQMQQLLTNLVLNAAEAIGSDPGVITVRTGLERVDERSPAQNLAIGELHPGLYSWLEVRDSGCGVDETIKSRIFDPFFSTKFTGRGLGLAAVGGMVRAHKGAIRVSSTPGKGSCFTVMFPALTPVVPPPPVPVQPAISRQTGTVLLVDDEEMVRKTAEKALERMGFNVLTAKSGFAAIDLYQRHHAECNLVILDLSMPGMNGQEVLPELRRIRADVPILVSSGYNELETMRFFEGQRVSGFLQKPYNARQLAEKIAEMLQ